MAQQLASRGRHTSLTSRHSAERAFLCRALQPRLCSRSTAVQCFKGSYNNGAKPTTTLRLNFRIPYRVNFGQSVGLVGSGDSLGNWDPKRTVPMKWTDGDWWTVELNVAPGTSALDLEYKYVVINADGNVGHWKPGSNYRVTLPLQSSSKKVPKRIKVADAWDDSFKKVDVEEADAAPSSNASSNAAGPSVKPHGQVQQPSQPQGRTQQQQQQPADTRVAAPVASTSLPQPQAAAGQAAAAPQRPSVLEPAATQSPPSPPAPAAVPLTVDFTPPPAAQSSTGPAATTSTQAVAHGTASSNGVAAPAPPPPQQAQAASSSTDQPPQAAQSGAPASQPQPQAQAGPSANGQNGAAPRSASPRMTSMTPNTFAAATAIPALHPSLLEEQERLEEGVRYSLEDLQTQMDKHQELRERSRDPAALEVLVADRMVAAANNRVMAYNKALKAVQEYNRLPPAPTAIKEASGAGNGNGNGNGAQ